MRQQLRPSVRFGLALVALGGLFAVSGAATGYPMTLAARAKVTSGETTVSSTVTIVVDRLMEPSRRTRVLDGLKYDGYKGFMNALRPLPPIGRVSTQNASVDLRYAWETKADDHRRLVLVADKPLFFLAADTSKARVGYELTVIELLLDDRNAGSGSMAGAARVKPVPDAGVALDDFAASLVELTVEPR